MDRNLALEVVRVTEAAALSCARWMGFGDGNKADFEATKAMRKAFSSISFQGRVVIGEGERDEAPMLYIGETLGDGTGPEVDVAVDPLEGTNLLAHGMGGAISVAAMGMKGHLLHAPDTYMDKIAVGPLGKGIMDLSKSPKENLNALARAKGVYIEDLTVVILDRERHHSLMAQVRETGARIRLITDGDVNGAIATCIPDSGIDVLMGIGGAPEGVLAACALKCLGGDFLGRLILKNQAEHDRCKSMGLLNPEQILTLEDLAKGDVMFAATGVTSGEWLKGVTYFKGGAKTHSFVMRSRSGTIRLIEATHHFDKKPHF